MASPLLIALLVFISVVLVVTGLLRRMTREERQSAFEQRLRQFQAQSQAAQIITEKQADVKKGRFSDMFDGLSLWVGEQMVSSRGGLSLLDWLDGQLQKAGNPKGWQATDLLARIFVALTFVLILGAYSVQVAGTSPLLFLALVAGVLYYPVLWLRGKITARQEQAFGELRYFLDEMILSLSSGTTTIDQALRRILFDSQDDELTGLKESERVLVVELRRAYTETQAQSRSFEDAYRDAASRIGVDLVSDLIDLLINAQLEGSPVLSALLELREQVQRLFGEEVTGRIKKLDSTMTVATVAVMFGCAINLVLPILNNVVQTLNGGVG